MHHDTSPVVRIIDLTPELAKDLLGRNPRNRSISKKNYATICRAIQHGEWLLNGEAIKVSRNGYILDGQHRCMAVAETGITIKTLLIENLPDETQDTMDTGKSRTLADILTIRGELQSSRLAAVTRRLLLLASHGLQTACTNNAGYVLTNHECLNFLEANPWIRDIIEPARQAQRNARFPGSPLVAVLMILLDKIDPEDASFFWARITDGAELAIDHPIYVLRRSLLNLSEDTRGERNEKYLAAITIKAWNAYRRGETMKSLSFRVGGATPEKFPEAI